MAICCTGMAGKAIEDVACGGRFLAWCKAMAWWDGLGDMKPVVID